MNRKTLWGAILFGLMSSASPAAHETELLLLEGEPVAGLGLVDRVVSVTANTSGGFAALVRAINAAGPIAHADGTVINERPVSGIWGSVFGEQPDLLVSTNAMVVPPRGAVDVAVDDSFALPNPTSGDVITLAVSASYYSLPGMTDRGFGDSLFAYSRIPGPYQISVPWILEGDDFVIPGAASTTSWQSIGHLAAAAEGTLVFVGTFAGQGGVDSGSALVRGHPGSGVFEPELVSGDVPVGGSDPIDSRGFHRVDVSPDGRVWAALVSIGGQSALVWNGILGAVHGAPVVQDMPCVVDGLSLGYQWGRLSDLSIGGAAQIGFAATVHRGDETRGLVLVNGRVRFQSGDSIAGHELAAARPLWLHVNASGDVLHAWPLAEGGQAVFVNRELLLHSDMPVTTGGGEMVVGTLQSAGTSTAAALTNRNETGDLVCYLAVDLLDGMGVDRSALLSIAFNTGGVARCPADVNGDSEITILDLLQFLDWWFDSELSADLNGDGIVSILDLLTFLEDWFVACQ